MVLAAQNYEMAYEHFPAGVRDTTTGPIDSTAQGLHHSWTIALLPYLDETAIFQNIQSDISVYDAAHQPVRNIRIATLTCPASPVQPDLPVSDYAACHHHVEAPIASDNACILAF